MSDKQTGDGVAIRGVVNGALDVKKFFPKAVTRLPIRRIGFERGRAVYDQPVPYQCAVRVKTRTIKLGDGTEVVRSVERYASERSRPSQAKLRKLRRRNGYHTR